MGYWPSLVSVLYMSVWEYQNVNGKQLAILEEKEVPASMDKMLLLYKVEGGLFYETECKLVS